jgi:hypothetical protein
MDVLLLRLALFFLALIMPGIIRPASAETSRLA